MEEFLTIVPTDWLDYNGHMNVAYYFKVFEESSVQLWNSLDIGAQYAKRENYSMEIKETHIQFIEEAHLGDALRIESRVYIVGESDILVGQEMFCDGQLLCRMEHLDCNVDHRNGNISPFEKKTLEKIKIACVESLKVHPEWIGRSVKMQNSR